MARRAAENLVTFTPSETFTGYPDGKTKVLFKAGIESEPVTETYAQLMRSKGLVAPHTQLHEPSEEVPE